MAARNPLPQRGNKESSLRLVVASKVENFGPMRRHRSWSQEAGSCSSVWARKPQFRRLERELHFLLCNLGWVQLSFVGSIQDLFVVPPVASHHLVTEVQPGVARMNMTCGSLDNFE